MTYKCALQFRDKEHLAKSIKEAMRESVKEAYEQGLKTECETNLNQLSKKKSKNPPN